MRDESIIEESFIKKLRDERKYTYREDIRNKADLDKNFRQKFQSLNRVNLTDAEFSRLKDEIISDDVYKVSKTLRSQNTFMREDGTPLHYMLVNIRDWCKNEFEVVSQLRINTDSSFHRYDVIILINGLPLVHVELKSNSFSPRKAMQQIVDYKSDKGNGFTNTIMCFVQLFVVSNETKTYYFANNNQQHFNFNADEQFLPIYELATAKNNKISNLCAFTAAFFPKCILAEMISRYMVLVATEKKMLIMRPYQIYAVKAIIDSIDDNRGNGYVWHTTGSGKTLTSFKASTLLKENPNIDKCLFVVDRKDLDRQTREEFNKFQENCVEENTNTYGLVVRLLSEDYADKVIVTTIQKLGRALSSTHNKGYRDQLLTLRDKKIVFIFDECHRSQFGDNHEAIKDFFPNSQLFGFTGTPIFEENAVQVQRTGNEARYMETEDIFKNLLHSYTITNAIEDKNVLRFHVDYYKAQGEGNEKAFTRPNKDMIVEHILNKHASATNEKKFNALFATNSINDAIEYYELFKKKQEELSQANTHYTLLNIACIFSPPAGLSEDVKQLQEDLVQEKEDYQQEPDLKKQALETIISDYNTQYKTNHSINEFDAYYQNVQKRIKDQQYCNQDYKHENKIDITIVVDMLLTGFDSKYLNTLYVDKRLKHHGLIQAFSRTNRVLNDSKPYGNILDFRGQQEAVDNAIKLFSQEKDTDADAVRKIWLVDSAPVVIQRYQQAVEELEQYLECNEVECSAEGVFNLKGDIARAGFINKFKEVQRIKTQLNQYTDLNEEQEEQISQLMPEPELRAFRAAYLETAKKFQDKKPEKGVAPNPELEQLDFELILFASATIDYDYIMSLLARYQDADPQSSKWKATKNEIVELIRSSSNMADESEDIIDYIESLGRIEGKTEEELREGYKSFKANKYDKLLNSIAEDQGLDKESLNTFVHEIIDLMRLDEDELSKLVAPLMLGWKERSRKKAAIVQSLIPLLQKMANHKEIAGIKVYES